MQFGESAMIGVLNSRSSKYQEMLLLRLNSNFDGFAMTASRQTPSADKGRIKNTRKR